MQINEKVTIKTIADATGFSFSTVSKALNRNPLIKEETRKIIEEKAEELGYTPNMSAKSLRSNKSRTVGIILNDVANPTLGNMLSVVASNLARMGYTAMICDSRFNEKDELMNVKAMISHNIDAVIISPVNPMSPGMKLLLGLEKRTIVLGTYIPGFNSNYITVDYCQGGYLSAAYMLSKGHTDNLILSEVDTTDISMQFLKGIRKAYEEFGVSLEDSRIHYAKPTMDRGRGIMLESLRKGEHVTGVICVCDSLAYGIYLAAEEAGFSIPDDVSVMGFDDYEQSRFINPKLSTIYLPKEGIANTCSELIKAILNGDNSTTRTMMLTPHLVERESVKNAWKIIE